MAIRTWPASKEYRDNWDKIFKKKEEQRRENTDNRRVRVPGTSHSGTLHKEN